MNINDMLLLRGSVSGPLEKKGELKRKDNAITRMADRIMDVGRKIRMLIKCKYRKCNPRRAYNIFSGI